MKATRIAAFAAFALLFSPAAARADAELDILNCRPGDTAQYRGELNSVDLAVVEQIQGQGICRITYRAGFNGGYNVYNCLVPINAWGGTITLPFSHMNELEDSFCRPGYSTDDLMEDQGDGGETGGLGGLGEGYSSGGSLDGGSWPDPPSGSAY